jgi:hypothetical protein
MLLLSVCYLLGFAEAPPPPPPPSASNSVDIKNIQQQFQNQNSPNCGQDEVYENGSCKSTLTEIEPPQEPSSETTSH